MSYEESIYKLDSTINPVGVENSIRLQYGTLDHDEWEKKVTRIIRVDDPQLVRLFAKG